jgi:hypothetical protein
MPNPFTGNGNWFWCSSGGTIAVNVVVFSAVKFAFTPPKNYIISNAKAGL